MKEFFERLNWVSVVGFLIAVEMQITNGTMSLTHSFPEAWIPIIKEWAGNLATVGGLMVGAGAFGRVQASSLPGVPPSVKSALMIGALLAASMFAFTGDARAQSKPPLTGNIVRDIAAANPNRPAMTGNPLGDIIGALDVKLLPDLQYALKLANASGSKVTGPCYQAWIDIINVRQKAVQDDQTPPQALPMPDPHLVTDFEKLVELRNSLQPDSEFMIKCSPVASMVKKDIVGFIGVVISGGTGLATLVPGL